MKTGTLIRIALIVPTLFLVWACPDPAGTVLTVSPSAPAGPAPCDCSYGVSKDLAALTWAASSVGDGSAVTYDVYFGAGELPAVPTAEDIATASWSPPSTLEEAADYRWKVVAKAANGAATSGGEWSFMTAGTILDYETRIPDAALRAALAAAAVKEWTEGITTEDLDAIEELTADYSSISTIAGLEFCHSLRDLSLRFNTISDASPLRRLTALEELTLQGNAIADISPLSGLYELIVLRVHNNPIPYTNASATITASNFPKLEHLGIRGQMSGSIYITSAQLVSILSRFSGLHGLMLRSFKDMTADELAYITTRFKDTLASLTLSSCGVTDTSFIASIAPLPHLDNLDVGWNALSSAAFTSSAEYEPEWYGALNYLSLDGNQGIMDISFLQDMYDAGSFHDPEWQEVCMEYLGLDVSESSAAKAVINYLEAGGVTVYYENQVE